MKRVLRIAIADDHEIVRNGLSMIIENTEGMQVDIAASSHHELLDMLEKYQIDILILDLNLGDLNGLGSLESVTKHYPSLPVLVLSAYPEEEYAVRAFKLGALGYLNKAVNASELIEAIHTIENGKPYISKTLAQTLPYGTQLERETKDISEILSKRELEVFTLIGQGKSSTEIADILSLSPKTISTYRSRIIEKLMLTSRTQLQRFAYEWLSGV
ncbi:two component transcriptional regulator, LuxR family [hydrothermal vent metagenome]|uniref:Two component transcriptional regulator, LuxR family n=1 Tax=hydrothermal vent metagenome TaxID=652676 RepID=A0A1W1E7J0_9ZZZZ